MGSLESYTIGWIAALYCERAAATALLDVRHLPPADFQQHPSDNNSYTWGCMSGHNIVIASLPAGVYGTTTATMVALNLLSSLPAIKVGLLVGIGGGIARHDDQDVRLGDVVVSQPKGTSGGVIQYDLGKATANGKWEPVGALNKPPLVLLNALAALRTEYEMRLSKVPDLLEAMWTSNEKMKDHPRGKEYAYIHQGFENDRLFLPTYDHIDGDNCDRCDLSKQIQRSTRITTDPEIHYGIIASGNTLTKTTDIRDKISESAGRDCICIEMEAAGLMDAFPCLVIRGICDYADSHKNDRWQRYASATASAYAKELLQHVPFQLLANTTRVVDTPNSIDVGVKNMLSVADGLQISMQDLREAVHSTQHTMTRDRVHSASRCYRCDHESHWLVECIAREETVLTGREVRLADGRCRNCGKYGHGWRECRRFKDLLLWRADRNYYR